MCRQQLQFGFGSSAETMPKHDANTYTPGEFADILKLDVPVFLVGGQAVNLWALYYYDKTYDLAPFVSRDVDILGDQTTLLDIAEKLNAKPHFFPMRPPTNEVGVVICKNRLGQPLPVEVLTHVYGIKNEELREPYYSMSLGDSDTIVQVPGPVALLKAKIANVSDIPQKGRQDKRHVQILLRILPGYLREVCSSSKNSKIKERKLLNSLENLLGIITSDKGKKVLASLNADCKAIFSELNADKGSKIDSFMKKRLTRAGFA